MKITFIGVLVKKMNSRVVIVINCQREQIILETLECSMALFQKRAHQHDTFKDNKNLIM